MSPSQNESPAEKKEASVLKTDITQLLIIIIFVVIPFRMFIAQPFIVSGTSMQPGFQDKDYLIVDQLTYKFNNPERGDTIVFKYPNDPKTFYIKRIIGLPGETVIIRDQEVFIQQAGQVERIKLTEPYTKSFRPDSDDVTLLDGQYYVMGDNRLVSSDSRVWGPLDEKFITGRAFIRVFKNPGILPENYKEYTNIPLLPNQK